MNSSLTRMFESLGGTGWWIIVLFFLFLAFQECWADNICITDWIPFLILLLIVCSCNAGDDDCGYMENNMDYNCNC